MPRFFVPQISLRTLLLMAALLACVFAYRSQCLKRHRFAVQVRAIGKLPEKATHEIRWIKSAIRRAKTALENGPDAARQQLWILGSSGGGIQSDPKHHLGDLTKQISDLADEYGNDSSDVRMLKESFRAWAKFYKISRCGLMLDIRGLDPANALTLYTQKLEENLAELQTVVGKNSLRLTKYRAKAGLVEQQSD